MGTDLRCKHDASLLVEAARLHDAGLGRRAIAALVLGVPHEAVRKWLVKYRAGGMELLLKMGGKQSRYDYGTKVAAASAVVDGGMGKPEAMKRFGIASMKPLERWCRLYREGGAEALRPKPKGRPKGRRKSRAQDPRAGARGARPQARGRDRLPKKIDSPEGGAALSNREKAAVAELSGQGHSSSDLLAAARLARSTYYYALRTPRRRPGRSLRARRRRDLRQAPQRVGHRQVAM